jgi:hypothetical protein
VSLDNPPSLADFVAALKVIEGYLRSRIEAMRAVYPDSKEFFDALLEKLKGSARTIEVLAAVATELKSFRTGSGPVSTDPVDLV